MLWNCAQLFLDTTQWLDTTLIVLDRHLTHCKEHQLESWLISKLMHKILIYLHIIHSFSTGAQNSHLQTVTIPEAAYIKSRPRPPEDVQG